MILVDVLALPRPWGATGAVIGSAIAFAVYHFPNLGAMRFSLALFYTAAGVYFAVIYVARGFGIVVGTHAIYDVLVVTLRFAQDAE
jgi:membrane protease YdiL (CAAX protease family)